MTWIDNKQQKPKIGVSVEVNTIYDSQSINIWNGEVWVDAEDYLNYEDGEILFWRCIETPTIKDQIKTEILAILEWLTNEDSTLAIMYGNQEERFASLEDEFTIDQVYEMYLKQK